MASLFRTVVRPVVTEKTSAAYQARGEYVFEVASDATKPAIRAAIEKLFGVKLAFRADLNYHVENFKIINAITGEEYR